MMTPPLVWQRVKAFREAGHTGRIVLDVKRGRVLGYRLTGRERVPSTGIAHGVAYRPATDSDEALEASQAPR